MNKTTVYLPDDLKAAVRRAAADRGVSEAEVIRESVRAGVGTARPRPRGGLFSSDDLISERVDDLLEGFGDDDR
jgi:plasmid stability protein